MTEDTQDEINFQDSELPATSTAAEEKTSLHQQQHQLSLALEESQQQVKQLQRVIYFLRERSEESHLEAKHLKEVFQTAQETISAVSQQYAAVQSENSDLNRMFSEEQKSRQEANEEIHALQHQFENLKNAVFTSKQELVASNQQVENLQQENAHLNHALQERDQCLKALENEIAAVKQTLVRGMREMQGLESRTREAIHDKASLANKLHFVQQIAEKQKGELHALQNQLKESSASISWKQRT